MPRPAVYHIIDEGFTEQGQDAVENESGLYPYGLTLCGKEATHRYRMEQVRHVNNFNARQMERVCARCRDKAVRLGLLQPIATSGSGRVQYADKVSSGDKQFDTWLRRLGV